MAYDLVKHRAKKAQLVHYHVNRFILSSAHWAAYNHSAIFQWSQVKFLKQNQPSVPAISGVYAFVARPDITDHPAFNYLFYIGQTSGQTLQARFTDYFYEKSKRKPRVHIIEMMDKWSDYLWFYFSPLVPPVNILKLEEDLIMAYLPPFNRQFPADVRDEIRGIFG